VLDIQMPQFSLSGAPHSGPPGICPPCPPHCYATAYHYGQNIKNSTFLLRVRIAYNADRTDVIATSCLSDRLSVCPTHSGVLSRRMSIRLCSFQLHVGQDAQLSQRNHAAGCVMVFAKSGRQYLRTL